MVAQESETAALGEYRGIIVDGTVFEAKDQMIGYTITLCDLRYLAVSQKLTLQGAEREKPSHQALFVTHISSRGREIRFVQSAMEKRAGRNHHFLGSRSYVEKQEEEQEQSQIH
jgi:hypothetical protein